MRDIAANSCLEIKLNRDNQMYEWETIARLPLSGTRS